MRIQTQPGFVSTLREAVPLMYKDEGIGGFYKSLVPLWMRQIPYTMMKFACFERTVELIYKYDLISEIFDFIIIGCNCVLGTLSLSLVPSAPRESNWLLPLPLVTLLVSSALLFLTLLTPSCPSWTRRRDLLPLKLQRSLALLVSCRDNFYCGFKSAFKRGCWLLSSSIYKLSFDQ